MDCGVLAALLLLAPTGMSVMLRLVFYHGEPRWREWRLRVFIGAY
jgi:hypothetical protein